MHSSDRAHQNCLAFDRIKLEHVVQNKDGGIQLPSLNSLQTIQIMKIHLQADQKPAVEQILVVDQSQAQNLNHRRNLRRNHHRNRKMCLKQNLNRKQKQVKSRTSPKSLQIPEVKPTRNRKSQP